jgi:hypothetical protein
VAKRLSAGRMNELMAVEAAKVTPKERLAVALQTAWASYVGLFGEQPHGTLPQMKALVAFIPDSFIGEPAKPGITLTQNDASVKP